MNWGNKLLLTFIVFGAGMGYLVYRSLSTNYELVEKDYYKQELRYQQVIDGTNRVNQLSSAVKIRQTDAGIILELPLEMKEQDISGDVLFYCAYDKTKDKKIAFQPGSNGVQAFPPNTVSPGKYTVKINWFSEGKNFYAEQLLTVI